MGITNQQGLDTADGILGLSPPTSKIGPSFVGSLKAQGIIDSTMISFYLTKSTTGSKFSFGGFLEEYLKPGSSLIWNSMVTYQGDYPYWQVSVKDLTIKDYTVFSGKTTSAVLDTGTSLVLIPYSEMLSLASYLKSTFGEVLFGCNDDKQKL